MQTSKTSYNSSGSALSRLGDGAQEALLDIVANPWTMGTFALVTTVGSFLMGQDRFPRLKGATCWVMRDGMKGMYYVGLGVSGARAVYNLAEEDYHGAGHAMTLGGSIAITKYVGDRWMQPFLVRAGEAMLRLAGRASGRMAGCIRTQGRAMIEAAQDRMAASGLALCAHSFDEIATMVVAAKSLTTWIGRVEVNSPELVSIVGAHVAPSTGKAGGASPSRELCSLVGFPRATGAAEDPGRQPRGEGALRSFSGFVGATGVSPWGPTEYTPVPLPNEDWDGMLPEPPLAIVAAGHAALLAIMATGAVAAAAGPAAVGAIEFPVVGKLVPAFAF